MSRYPFLFLDRILEERDKKLIGLKNVSANEVYFTGHFPDQPVMPGVLIVESLSQAAQVLVRKAAQKPDDNPVLVGLEKMRFRKPVLPGNQLILDVELIEWNGSEGKVRGEARVGDEVAASGQLTLSLGQV